MPCQKNVDLGHNLKKHTTVLLFIANVDKFVYLILTILVLVMFVIVHFWKDY